MDDPGFNIHSFSESALYGALSHPHTPAPEVQNHKQAHYLYGYLRAIGAKTIVVEELYTDGDYLDDFANYYVKCHQNYARRCKRLHFFSAELTKEDLTSLILRRT